ncbi:MAG: lipopolysaccharide biosynthesis protein [Desulfatirhabdiaceae bacterium]
MANTPTRPGAFYKTPAANDPMIPSAQTSPPISQALLGKKVAMNSLVGMMSRGFYFFSRLAVTPITLHFVPLDQFGLWSICFVVLSYAGMGVFGMNAAYIKYTAQYHRQGDIGRINRLLSTGLLCMGGFSLVVFGILWGILPVILAYFKVGNELRDVARILILGTALAFLGDLALGGFRGMLEGLQETAFCQTVFLIASLIELGAMIAFLAMGWGVYGLLFAYLLRTVIDTSACMVSSFRKLPGLRIGWQYVDRNSLPLFYNFGAKVQVLGLMGIFMNTFDRLVATGIAGLEAAAMIEIGRKFPFSARGIASSAIGPLMPAASYMGSQWENETGYTGRDRMRIYGYLSLIGALVAALILLPCHIFRWHAEAWSITSLWAPAVLIPILLALWPGWTIWKRCCRFILHDERIIGADVTHLYLNGSRHINLLNSMLFMLLIAVANPLIFAWVGPGYELAAWLMILFAATNLVHLATGPGSLILRGFNRSGREFEYTVLRVATGAIWTLSGAWVWGVTGAVAGISAATVSTSIYFIWRANRLFEIPWAQYCRHTVLPCLAPLLAGVCTGMFLAVLPNMNRWQTLAGLVACGALFLMVTALILHRFFLTSSEKAWMLRGLRRLGFAGTSVRQ